MNEQHTTVEITGMTCEHCVASVTEELSEIPGVSGVDVQLDPHGTSRATIRSTQPLPDEQLTHAIEEAGYHRV